jgi:hypothetical protein
VDYDLPTDKVILEVTRNQALSLIDAVVASNKKEQSAPGGSLLPLSWELRNAGLHEVLSVLNRTISPQEPVAEEGGHPITASHLLPVLSVLFTAGAYFSMPRTHDSWIKDLEAGGPQLVAEMLANCKADLAVDPDFALARLAELKGNITVS